MTLLLRDFPAQYRDGMRGAACRASRPHGMAGERVAREDSGVGRKHLRAHFGTIPAYGRDECVKGVKLRGAVMVGPAARRCHSL